MNPPSPYHNKSNKIKAFVLGCDPTAFDKNRKPIELEFVFGINMDKRYFAGINTNLLQLGLSREHVYIQNLITDYQEKETAKNPEWLEIAQQYIENRSAEFNAIDPSKILPVFLTSELLYKALLNSGEALRNPTELYNSETDFYIPANKNKLSRPLVPLYRHPVYSLKNQVSFVRRVIKAFNF